MLEGEGVEQPKQYCRDCGAEGRPGNAFCVSCGERVAPDAQSSDRSRAGSNPDGFTTGDGGRTAGENLKEAFGQAAQDVYSRSKEAYGEASARYRDWSAARAAEQERSEVLRAVEGEREARRRRLERYVSFFERARDGSQRSLDWWQAYQDEESEGEQPSIPNLLRSARSRGEAGLVKIRGMEESLDRLLQEGSFGEADRLLDEVRKDQEGLEGEESVFPPLVAVHARVKGLNGWEKYREELEKFVEDLEELLGSPKVRTAPANRLRFPDPRGAHPSDVGGMGSPGAAAPEAKDVFCPSCGERNGAGARFCFSCGMALSYPPGSSGPYPSGRVAAPPSQGDMSPWILLSVAFATIALFLFPPVFGGLGVYFGYRAKQAGTEAGGVAMMVVSGACMLLGMLWGSLTWGL